MEPSSRRIRRPEPLVTAPENPLSLGLILTSRHVKDQAYIKDMRDAVAAGIPDMLNLASTEVVPPDRTLLKEVVRRTLAHSALVIVCGGTGLSPDDTTPQVLDELADYQIPGIGEFVRARSLQFTAKACLSRGGAWVKNQKLLLALPGSARAASQQLEVLREVVRDCVCALGSRCNSR